MQLFGTIFIGKIKQTILCLKLNTLTRCLLNFCVKSLLHHTNQSSCIMFITACNVMMYRSRSGVLNAFILFLKYSSQQLNWIKIFHQSCPKTKMRSCLRTTLMNFFDALQMLTTVIATNECINLTALIKYCIRTI